jgi:hypothetical protein
MFVEASLRGSHGKMFITDDKEFRDSYYEELMDIVEQDIKQRDKESGEDSDYYYRHYLDTCDKESLTSGESFWYHLYLRSLMAYTSGYLEERLFTALLYKKACEFGYDLKAATDGGEKSNPKLIFMKPSAPMK